MIRAPDRRRGTALALMLLVACGGNGAAPEGEPVAVIETGAGEVRVQVEVADTAVERQRGLMGRTELAADAGMVFLQQPASEGGFWMKDTLVPLSVAFWGEDGRIHTIRDMEPCAAEPCEVYPSSAPWTGALEVNQGFFQENGVAIGDAVALER